MSEVKPFVVGRVGGKSNQQVVVDFVCAAEPGATFTYDQIAAALAEGTDRIYDRREVQQVVRLANRRLLREYRRVLRTVVNVGYSVAHAKDHLGLASVRNTRGQRQFRWALETLENVRLDEMTEQQRMVHVAQQSVNAELFQTTRRILTRQAQHAKLIASLTHRVEQVEGKAAGKG